MKVLADRRLLLDAINLAAMAVPQRSPKTTLLNYRLHCDPDGVATIASTDLEQFLEVKLLGATTERPGTVLLLASRTRQIVGNAGDDFLCIEEDRTGSKLTIRGERDRYSIVADDPSKFPVVGEFDAKDYYVVPAPSLKRAIKRTQFSVNPESSSYAFSGILFDLAHPEPSLVAIDGRRMARQRVDVEVAGNPAAIKPQVIPAKAVRLLDKAIAEDSPPVHIAVTPNRTLFRTDRATITTANVDGLFPDWSRYIPTGIAHRFEVDPVGLEAAVRRASVMASEESQGIDLEFDGSTLRMSAIAADVGESHVEHTLGYEVSPPLTVTFTGKYVSEPLKILGGESRTTLGLISETRPIILSTDDGFDCVVAPMEPN